MPDHPQRRIVLEGATNFRDLGGYQGADGRYVRWRQLFRSEHLAGLSPADLQRLSGLKIARTFDFRGVNERAMTPYELPGVVQHSLSIEPTIAQELALMLGERRRVDVAEARSLMERLYVHLVDSRSDRFAELFELLLDDERPVVFHCTAGKDRTGIAAALLLRALGVPEDIVARDYLLTNDFYRRPTASVDSELSDEVLQVLWYVDASYLRTALHTIESRHGGLGEYLSKRIRLSPAALRALRERYLTTSAEPPRE